MMENDVMDAEGSLHQKTNEVSVTEDAESNDSGWFENTQLKSVRKVLDVCYRWTSVIGSHLARLRQEISNGVW